jgi:predicted Zn-dependent protease
MGLFSRMMWQMPICVASASRLSPKTLRSRVSWKFRAFRDLQPNAFALPNGSIYVSTGLIFLIDNESQLAAIIARERCTSCEGTVCAKSQQPEEILSMNIMAAIGAYAPMGIVGAVIVGRQSPFI